MRPLQPSSPRNVAPPVHIVKRRGGPGPGIRTRAPSGGQRHAYDGGMGRAEEEENRRLLRARDAIDRRYDEPLDVRALAAIALVSEAHFIRRFKAVFGETPAATFSAAGSSAP